MTGLMRRLWQDRHPNLDRLESIHQSARVQARHLALPVDAYPRLRSFGEKNAAWVRVGLEVGERAIRDALDRAGLEPRDVDHFFFTTITGIATPSLEATLANRLGMRADVKRSPLFGLGCAAGAAAVGRMADLLTGHPDQVALLVAVELCTLTMQPEDLSMTNLVASGLFGDGAAAVIMGGSERFAGRGPRVVATGAHQYKDTEWVMGWDVIDSGLKVVLSPKVPEVVTAHVRSTVDGFLARHGVSRRQIAHWICHPGGPKVLEAIEGGLELPSGALDISWRSLAEVGNLSSASVLMILGDTLEQVAAKPGDYGVLMAMGPGFGAELSLLRW